MASPTGWGPRPASCGVDAIRLLSRAEHASLTAAGCKTASGRRLRCHETQHEAPDVHVGRRGGRRASYSGSGHRAERLDDADALGVLFDVPGRCRGRPRWRRVPERGDSSRLDLLATDRDQNASLPCVCPRWVSTIWRPIRPTPARSCASSAPGVLRDVAQRIVLRRPERESLDAQPIGGSTSSSFGAISSISTESLHMASSRRRPRPRRSHRHKKNN